MADERSYLDEVADHLPFIEPVKADVMTELADHFADSIQELTDQGLSIDGATSEVIRRMGQPEDLARSIVRSHQTPRRLLAAAGVGAIQGGRIALGGLIRTAIVATMLVLPIWLATVASRIGIEQARAIMDQLGAVLLAVAWAVAAFLVGRDLPERVAAAGRRSILEGRLAVGVVGGLLTAWFAWSFYRIDQTWVSVALLSLMPVILTIAVFRVGESRWKAIKHPYWILFGFVALMAVVAYLTVSSRTDPYDVRDGTPEFVAASGLPALGDTSRLRTSDLHVDVQNGGSFHQLSVPLAPSDLPYQGLSAEVWRARPDLTGMEPGQAAPLLRAPLRYGTYDEAKGFSLVFLGMYFYGKETESGYVAQVPHSLYRDWGPTYVVLIGESADGQRYVLDYRITGNRIAFTGSVLEWLLAR